MGFILENAFLVCGYFGIPEFGRKLLNCLTDLLSRLPSDRQLGFINRVFGQSVLSLRRLKLFEEARGFLYAIRPAARGWDPTLILPRNEVDQLEIRAKVLQARVTLAAGWVMIGEEEGVANVLEEAHCELLSPTAPTHNSHSFATLANAYVLASGELRDGTAIPRLSDFFRQMDRRKITNTWATALFYSRFHLEIVDTAVLTISRMAQ